MISLIHPSRQRVELCRQTIFKWLSKADNLDNIEYILSVDEDDPRLQEYKEMLDSFNFKVNKQLLVCNNKTAIQAINMGATASTGDILIVVSDDFDCSEHWDSDLLKEVEGKEDFVLKTKDGIQDFIITIPIMDRKYYKRFGYIYVPEYLHMFVDTEMSAVGHMLGKTINSNLFFKHNHYIVGGMQRDMINIKNDRTWEQGKETFYNRKKINFGLKDSEIINQYPEGKI